MLAYNGRGNRMPDNPGNYGCDGADSTYDELCDVWYEWVHCKDLEDGKGLNSRGLTSPQTDKTLDEMLAIEITEERCAGSQRVTAMKMYLKSPDCLIDYPPPAGDCVTPAPTPAPTAIPTNEPTLKPEELDVSECRLQAMAALTLWLISVLQ